jgi:hypothetical protein
MREVLEELEGDNATTHCVQERVQTRPPPDTSHEIQMRGGVRYQGELDMQGIPHGHGRMNWPCGRTFQGIYEHGKRVSGTMVWPGECNRKYSGQWKDNKPHGVGTCFSTVRGQEESWTGYMIRGQPQVVEGFVEV